MKGKNINERHTHTFRAMGKSGISKPMRQWRSPPLDLCLSRHKPSTNYHLLHLSTHRHALTHACTHAHTSFLAGLLGVNETISSALIKLFTGWLRPPAPLFSFKTVHSHLLNFYNSLWNKVFIQFRHLRVDPLICALELHCSLAQKRPWGNRHARSWLNYIYIAYLNLHNI